MVCDGSCGNDGDEAYTEQSAGRRADGTRLKRFSPERKSVVIDDAFNGAEVHTVVGVLASRLPSHRGPRAWHVDREAAGTCEASLAPRNGAVVGPDRKKVSAMAGGESDSSIVLRGGRTDHMGKGWAGLWNRQADQDSDA